MSARVLVQPRNPLVKVGSLTRTENPTVAEVAAFTVYAFAVGHPFNDANKRTALAVGDLILLMNDERIIAKKHEIELADVVMLELIIELAAGDIGQDQFIKTYIEMLERGDCP